MLKDENQIVLGLICHVVGGGGRVGWGGVGWGWVSVGWGGVLFTQLDSLTKNVNKSLLISWGGNSQRRESDSAGFDVPGG